ncbi:MAG: DUF4105 domain-containing protein [Bacteroidota bacterium]
MKPLRIAALSFILILAYTFSNAQLITKDAEISLLTCSAGDELYSVFGHSAIRVNDSTTGQDIVFNYGVFDFDTPNFYWKFVRGKLMYQLAIQQTDRFIQAYKYEGRSVKEEHFNLTTKEKAKLIAFLKKNYKPENRHYLYDFFYKNCSSIIWDVLTPRINDKLSFDSTVYQPQSFRQMLHPPLEDMPWAKFGIDIALGTPADKTAGFTEQMFLPAYLSTNMRHTHRNNPVNGSKHILREGKILTEKDKTDSPFLLFTPQRVFWAVFVLILAMTIFIPKHKVTRITDYSFFTLQGLLGLLLLFLWVGTDHSAMNTNINLLWANPFAIILVFFLNKKKNQIKSAILIILFLTALLTLLGWNLLPQQFNPAFIPISLSVILRASDHLIKMKKDRNISYIIKPMYSKSSIQA